MKWIKFGNNILIPRKVKYSVVESYLCAYIRDCNKVILKLQDIYIFRKMNDE